MRRVVVADRLIVRVRVVVAAFECVRQKVKKDVAEETANGKGDESAQHMRRDRRPAGRRV